MGVEIGVGLANRRSLPPQGSWGLNVYFFIFVLDTEWGRVGRSQVWEGKSPQGLKV